MDYEFSDFFDNYTEAFDIKKIDRILKYFNNPCLIIIDKNVFVCSTAKDVERVITNSSRFLSTEPTDFKNTYSIRNLFTLDDDNQLVTLFWRVENRAGQEVFKYSANYHLMKTNKEVKIVAVTYLNLTT